MKYKGVKTFKTNSVSPFIDELLEVQISSKRRILAGRKPSLIVNSESGEIEGTQIFAVTEKVDKEQFTKVFRKGLAAMFGLTKSGIKVFSFISSIMSINSDIVWFDTSDCMKYTGYKTVTPVHAGLSELLENNFIARTDKHYKYFINPTMFFNGSRVAFVKMFTTESEKTTTMKILPNTTI